MCIPFLDPAATMLANGSIHTLDADRVRLAWGFVREHPTPWVINVIGSAAAVCTTSALIPQLIHVWRLKTARDISLLMFFVYSIGELLWLLYGVYIHSTPVIAANAVSLVLALSILWLKLRYDHRRSPLARPTASAGK